MVEVMMLAVTNEAIESNNFFMIKFLCVNFYKYKKEDTIKSIPPNLKLFSIFLFLRELRGVLMSLACRI